MKQPTSLPLIIALSILFLINGCGRNDIYHTKLAPDERVTEMAQVFVDNHPAGFVKELRTEAGDRVAVLAFTDHGIAQEKLKVGIVRVVEEGRIHLRTEAVRPESPVLPAGS